MAELAGRPERKKNVGDVGIRLEVYVNESEFYSVNEEFRLKCGNMVYKGDTGTRYTGGERCN